MKNHTKKMNCLKSACLALALAGPLAVAGPKEDNEQAIEEFNRGDLVVSTKLWRQAAEQGYAPAQVWLGEILDKSEDDEEAVAWYRKAAAQGDAAGEYGLGVMYAKGEGVTRDSDEARKHILKAAEKNFVPALVMMVEAYRKGKLGLTVDPVQAGEWEAKLVQVAPNYEKKPEPEKAETKKRRRK